MSLEAVLTGAREFAVHPGDAIAHMREMPEGCVHHAVFSPPFPSVYSYTDLAADLGNSEGLEHEAPLHFSFFFRALLRVLAPGRAAVVHCTQIALLKRSGRDGIFDFRGLLIRLAQRAGFVYEYDWLVRVNPQSQAVRTHAHELQFSGLERDRANCRGALGMYLIKLQKPGENPSPVRAPGEVSRGDWIGLAEPCWADIKETDTLNVARAKGAGDTRHICPLQLGIYERSIRLFSDPGELVFDPFAGVGSCGFVALGGESPVTGRHLREPRRFYGVELKDSYWRRAGENCELALRQRAARSKSLFGAAEQG